MTGDFELTDDTPVYVISVAAQLSGLHPQTLRAYDRLGLVSPGRAAGGGRRYSLRDILSLREIQRLSQEEGINLNGIKRILELELAERRNRADHGDQPAASRAGVDARSRSPAGHPCPGPDRRRGARARAAARRWPRLGRRPRCARSAGRSRRGHPTQAQA